MENKSALVQLEGLNMKTTPSKRITPTVRKVLANNYSARESYTELLRLTYKQFGLVLTQEQVEILHGCPSPESITRAARKIWEGGDYLPSKDTRNKRQELQKVYRWEFSGDKAFKVEVTQ